MIVPVSMWLRSWLFVLISLLLSQKIDVLRMYHRTT